MKRSLIFGLIAVLSAGLLFVACDNGTDGGGGGGYVINGRLIDIPVANEGDLNRALLNPEYEVIGVTTNILLTGGLVIPADKTVVLYASLTPAADLVVEVKGTLIVDGAGTLVGNVSAGKRVLITDGYIEVNDGTITVDTVAAIYSSTAGSNIEVPSLGTGKIRFNGGSLGISETIAKVDEVKTAFSWVPKGRVGIGGIAEKINASDFVQAIPTVSSVRRLYIDAPVPFVGAGDTVEELEIPAGLYFETEDPLSSLKTLTVKGGFSASKATLANLETLNVEGEGALEAAEAMYTKLTDLTVSSSFTPATDLIGLKTLTVKAGGEFTASSVTGGTDGVTLTVEKEGVVIGTANITSIKKLAKGDIQGALTAVEFTATVATPTETPLTVAAGGAINGITFPSETKINALGSINTVTAGALTVPAGAVLVIPGTEPGPAKTLTIAAGSTLTYDGLVNIVPGAKLILATGTGSSVAKIAGTGKITAGLTTISGAWDAVATAEGTVTIESVAAGVGAKITAVTANGLKAGAGAIITQNAGASNNLTIGEATEIDLGGTDAEVGVIILKNDTTEGKANADNNAKLTLSADTSTIKTGNAIGAKGAAKKLSDTSVSLATDTDFTAFGINNLAGDGTNAKATSTVATAADSAGPAGKLSGLLGTDGQTGTVKGGGIAVDSPDGRISALSVTNAAVAP